MRARDRAGEAMRLNRKVRQGRKERFSKSFCAFLALFAVQLLALSGCAAPTPPIQRVALLAPFEGRYRELGYNALYAARMAVREAANPWIELYPVDDGGSAETAAARARALAGDPLVKAAVVLGYAATSSDALSAFGGLPVVIAGHWDASVAGENLFMLASPDLQAAVTAPARVDVLDAAALPAPVAGGDVFALAQFARLRDALDGVTVVSSGRLPDAEFAARYREGEEFAPEPGLPATLTYDAVRFALAGIVSAPGVAAREDVAAYLHGQVFAGWNGDIDFEDGYWTDGPVRAYVYDAGGTLRAE